MEAAHGCLALVQLILAKVCIVNSNLLSIVGHGVILLLSILGEIVFIVLVTRRKDVDHCLGRPKVNAVLVHLAQQKKVGNVCASLLILFATCHMCEPVLPCTVPWSWPQKLPCSNVWRGSPPRL